MFADGLGQQYLTDPHVVRPARVLSPKLRSCYLDLDLCHLDARTLICSLVVFLVLPFCI